MTFQFQNRGRARAQRTDCIGHNQDQLFFVQTSQDVKTAKPQPQVEQHLLQPKHAGVSREGQALKWIAAMQDAMPMDDVQIFHWIGIHGGGDFGIEKKHHRQSSGGLPKTQGFAERVGHLWREFRQYQNQVDIRSRSEPAFGAAPIQHHGTERIAASLSCGSHEVFQDAIHMGGQIMCRLHSLMVVFRRVDAWRF